MISYEIPELTSFADVEVAVQKFLNTPHAIKGPTGQTETVYKRWQRLEALVSQPHTSHNSTRFDLEAGICQHTDAICFIAIDVLPMLKDFERQAMALASKDSSFEGLKITEAKKKAKEMVHRHTRWVEMAEGLLEAAKEGLRALQSLNANSRNEPSA
jgi:hypothetical protein